MFGLGVPELLFIFVLALLIFGPKKLPEVGRTLGRGLREFRRASNEVQRTLNADLALEDEKEQAPARASRIPVVSKPAPATATEPAAATPTEPSPEPPESESDEGT